MVFLLKLYSTMRVFLLRTRKGFHIHYMKFFLVNELYGDWDFPFALQDFSSSLFWKFECQHHVPSRNRELRALAEIFMKHLMADYSILIEIFAIFWNMVALTQFFFLQSLALSTKVYGEVYHFIWERGWEFSSGGALGASSDLVD